jgi:formate dehydrogenase major subunit
MICEKEGLTTNCDRRIQYSTLAVEPPGDAKPDWEILQMLANSMGANWNYQNTEEIWNEVRRVAPIFSGASYERLKKSQGLRWPIYNLEDSDTLRLYEKRFEFRDGRARFYPISPPKFLNETTEDYNFMLVTHRLFEHFNTGEMTRRCKLLTRNNNEGFIAMNKIDYDALSLSDTENNIRITSPFGTMLTTAKILPGIYIPVGYIFAPIHFFNTNNFNSLTSTYPLDAYAKMPSLKSIPVNILKETI